ncbi:glyoxalase/bleomycin resistance/extradiol dioxygenase family protein [Rhodobacteraceae bacterium 2CG4]|uniref:Glyoxalase/bleomycin resistance/extradiol dioxygenase family protein n=1 Tax=Halovulum marinum TaxID=2662447 RepID=A0A6L5YYA1_9RHOB|nr:VOC family protein [Halovulum marinum]MSU89266.1 glyoxalase/bleomycin resistance/extradiol dioxygenase family protein [Halovulum marinum]
MSTETKPPPCPGILETGIYADDLDAATRFYRDLLGLEVLVAKPGRHVFFRLPTGMLLVFRAAATRVSGDPARPGHLAHGAEGPGHVCFAATGDALDRWRAHLQAAGVAIEDDFEWPNGARSIYVRDPAGNSVEFAEPRLWGITLPPAAPAG